MEENEKFYDLSEDSIEMVTDVIDTMALPFNLKIKYIGTTKLKGLVKLQKLSDIISHITNIDLLIFINEDYAITLEEENCKILIHQELDRLQFDVSKGTFKIGKYPLQTTEGVLRKYGIEAVSKANQLSQLYGEQKQDKEEFEEKVQSISTTKRVEFLD